LIDRMFKAHGPDNTNLTLETLGIPLRINEQGEVSQVQPAASPEQQPPADPGPAAASDGLEPANPPLQ